MSSIDSVISPSWSLRVIHVSQFLSSYIHGDFHEQSSPPPGTSRRPSGAASVRPLVRSGRSQALWGQALTAPRRLLWEGYAEAIEFPVSVALRSRSGRSMGSGPPARAAHSAVGEHPSHGHRRTRRDGRPVATLDVLIHERRTIYEKGGEDRASSTRGLSLAGDSRVVSGRGCSSRSKARASPFFCGTDTGTISSANLPASMASAALS